MQSILFYVTNMNKHNQNTYTLGFLSRTSVQEIVFFCSFASDETGDDFVLKLF